MRHQTKRHRIGRGSSHRRATLASLSSALIQHKRIVTTEAKAKALRVFVEPLISRSREDTTHNRRQVFRRLQDKHAVTELFGEIGEKVADRPGGYTRIVKLGQRHGDAAPMAVIELVDYNDVKPEGAGGRRKKTRRGRSRRAGGAAAAAVAVEETVESAAETLEDAAAEETEDSLADAAAEEVPEAAEEPVTIEDAEAEVADEAPDADADASAEDAADEPESADDEDSKEK